MGDGLGGVTQGEVQAITKDVHERFGIPRERDQVFGMGGEQVKGAGSIQRNGAAQAAQVRPPVETRRQQLKRTSIEVDLQTEDGLNPRIPASRDEFNGSREQVVIGQSQRGHAMFQRGLDEFGGCCQSLLQGIVGVAGEMEDHLNEL